MATLDSQVIAGLARINQAKQLADAAGERYYEACENYDWIAAEQNRFQMISHLEAFMDQIAATYRLMEALKRGR